MPNHTVSRNDNYIPVIIWFISLVCFYNGEIRSIGSVGRVESISVVANVFQLSDFGLVLPIFIIGWSRGLKIFTRINLFIFLSLTFAYGLGLFFVRNNLFISVGYELRIFTAVITGFSLVYIMRNDYEMIIKVINIVLFIIAIMTTYHLIIIPDVNIIYGVRILSEVAYFFTAMLLVLFSPMMIASAISKKRFNIIISWSNLLLFFLIAGILLKTRSLFIVSLIGLLFALFSIQVLNKYLISERKYSSKTYLLNKSIFIFLTIPTIVLFSQEAILYFSQDVNILVFTERFSQLGMDEGTIGRQEEVLSVLNTMDFIDIIFGMGLSPPSPLINLTDAGLFVNSVYLHIGILNIWWRFGLIVFILWLFMYLKLIINWLKAVESIKRKMHSIEIMNKELAIIICAPGVFALFSLSLMSGGWTVHTMLPLGMLLGLYCVMTDEPQKKAE